MLTRQHLQALRDMACPRGRVRCGCTSLIDGRPGSGTIDRCVDCFGTGELHATIHMLLDQLGVPDASPSRFNETVVTRKDVYTRLAELGLADRARRDRE